MTGSSDLKFGLGVDKVLEMLLVILSQPVLGDQHIILDNGDGYCILIRGICPSLWIDIGRIGRD